MLRMKQRKQKFYQLRFNHQKIIQYTLRSLQIEKHCQMISTASRQLQDREDKLNTKIQLTIFSFKLVPDIHKQEPLQHLRWFLSKYASNECQYCIIIVQYLMQFLSPSAQKQALKVSQLCGLVALTMQRQGNKLVSHKAKNQKKAIMFFTNRISFPKSRQVLDVLWEITASAQLLKIKIKLNSSESNLCSNFCCFFREKRKEVCQFVYQINNLRIKDSEGSFYLQQSSGEIGFETKVQGMKFISTEFKILLFLKNKLTKILNIFMEEIQNIIFYYKLPGFNLQQYESEIQNPNHSPLKKVHDKIVNLRNFFNSRIEKDKKGISPNQIKIQQGFANNFNLLYGMDYLHPQLFQIMLNENNNKVKYEFKQEKNLLVNDFEKYQTQKFDPILTTIEIKEKEREKYLSEGGYSTILQGIYSFVPQLSIHKDINNSVKAKGVLKTSFLVRKKCQENKISISLKNEFNFLFFMRNKVCPYLAKYYCNNTIMPFSDGQLYLQYYPCSLRDCRLEQTKKLKILEDVCMGLFFLSMEGIIHRDLKEENIMIDRKNRGRIIDFGSVTGAVGASRFKPIDNKCRFTEGYFIPYEQSVQMVPSLSNRLNRSEFYNHKNFDQYSLGKIFHQEFYLDSIVEENHFLRYNLNFLAQKCMEPDPENRLSIEEATVFLRQLMIYLELRRQFWKFTFDQKNRVHIFGELHGDREIKMRAKQAFEQQMLEKRKSADV